MSARTILLEFPSTVDMLELVDSVCERFGQMAGFDSESAHRICVAVREAVANAVKHGNRHDPGKQVRVEFELVQSEDPIRIVVRVRDEGDGFDMDAVPNPLRPDKIVECGGRGVFLIRTFMDDVQVREAPGGGTEIVMAKNVGGPSV